MKKERRRVRPRSLGFSLIELMVTVGIAASLSLIAVPSLSTLRNQYQLRAAADQLAFEVGHARMQAVAQNVFVRIRFVSNSQYVRERSTSAAGYVQDGATNKLPGGVVTPCGGTTVASFNKSGLAAEAKQVLLTNPAGNKTVSVNQLGRATVS